MVSAVCSELAQLPSLRLRRDGTFVIADKSGAGWGGLGRAQEGRPGSAQGHRRHSDAAFVSLLIPPLQTPLLDAEPARPGETS